MNRTQLGESIVSQSIIKVVQLVIVACLVCPVYLFAANIYVMGTAADGGNGSRQHPYNSLAGVELNSTPGDKITVLYSDVALDGGILLKEGQHLQGEKGKKDDKHKLPVITNTSLTTNDGNGIVAAKEARVSFVNVKDVLRSGIFFGNASNLVIKKNIIENPNRGAFVGFPVSAAIKGIVADGAAMNVLIEDNEINANGHNIPFTRGIYVGTLIGGTITGVVQGNNVSDMNGRAYYPFAYGNGFSDLAFYDNSARTIGPGNADSFFIEAADSGQISVDVKNYFIDNSQIGVLGNPFNHGFEVWTKPVAVFPGTGTAAKVNVTADQLIIQDSAADGISIWNNSPDSEVSITVSNSLILRAAGRLTGGLGVVAQLPLLRSGTPLPNQTLTLKVDTTDIIGTLPGLNLFGLPTAAVHIYTAGSNDVYDLGGGALGSIGQNRILDNPLDYVTLFNQVDIFAEHNYYGGGAPSHLNINGDVFFDRYLTEDPRP